MANDFSAETNLQAQYRWESGALTADSSGKGNSLTNWYGPAETGTCKEGSGAVDFEDADADGQFRLDADLTADFPLKNGDTNKKFSFCFWFRPETVPGASDWDDLVAKWNYPGSVITLEINLNNSKLTIGWAHTSGQQAYFYPTHTVSANQWYHASVIGDGVNKELVIYVWDETAEQLYTYGPYSPANELRITNAKFTIAMMQSNLGYVNFFDGIMDELLVFNRCLSKDEAKSIRMGIFPEAPGPTQEQLLRHGTWFGDGAKQRMWFAK